MPASPEATNQDDAVRAAVARSNLRDVPAATWAELGDGADRRLVPAGATLHDEGDSRPHLELVVSGLLRVSVVAADGRSLTVRYARPGALLGAATLFSPGFQLPATIQAIVASEILALSPDAVDLAVDRDPRLARALLAELSERVLSFVSEIPWGAFASVRKRVARRLLDLATEDVHGPRLVTRISQAQLAAECGTVREVVVRELRELRARGLVETRRDVIVVVDPEGLLKVSSETAPG